VSEHVTRNELNVLQIAIPPPIFTKLATEAESREVWLPIVLVEICKTHVSQTGSGINFYHCSYGKIALMSNISKTATNNTMRVNESRIWNHTGHRLSPKPLILDDLELS